MIVIIYGQNFKFHFLFRYLGFSWASGIVTLGGLPNPNGRNQESSSESIAAYEAVALYGQVMAKVFQKSVMEANQKKEFTEIALRVRDTGRVLMSTEIRSAQVYYHVQSRESTDAVRIYPGNIPYRRDRKVDYDATPSI